MSYTVGVFVAPASVYLHHYSDAKSFSMSWRQVSVCFVCRTRRKNRSTKTDWNDVIIINVGGVRHETLRATLNSHPGTRLADLARLRRHYRPDKNDYFFDRSPALFEYILNFYRVGELHLPPGSCSEMVQREFEYWGIDKHQLRGGLIYRC